MRRSLSLILALILLFSIGLLWKVALRTSFLGNKTEATVKSITAQNAKCSKYGIGIGPPFTEAPCTMYTLNVDYKSEDGKPYSSTIDGDDIIGEGHSSDSSKYKANDKIIIRYNPNNPTEAAENRPIFLTIVFFVLIGIELLLLYFAIYPQAVSKIAAQFSNKSK